VTTKEERKERNKQKVVAKRSLSLLRGCNAFVETGKQWMVQWPSSWQLEALFLEL